MLVSGRVLQNKWLESHHPSPRKGNHLSLGGHWKEFYHGIGEVVVSPLPRASRRRRTMAMIGEYD